MSNVPSRSWPIKRLPDQFGVPTNAQVGRVQDLVRPHPLNDATSAADILADAVFYIDAQEHAADGGNVKTVRNRGWGGSVLNARCGSTSVPDTNDPRFLAAEPTAYVYLPGGSTGNTLTVPNETALQITGDLDIRAYVSMDSWTPSGRMYFVSKDSTSYSLAINTAKTLRFIFSGTNSRTVDTTATVPFADGAAGWIRVTLDVDNGASGNTIIFYTSTDGVTWTTLETSTAAGVATVSTNTSTLFVGALNGGPGTLFTGRVYRAIVKNAIDGTTVLDVDTSVLTTGSATSFTATTGQTVTINRSTSGRKTVVVPDRSRSGGCWLFGTDDYMEVPTTATGSRLLDFGPNDSFTVLAVVRQWATPASFASLVGKYDATRDLGWTIRQFSTGFYYQYRIADEGARQSSVSNSGMAVSAGTLQINAGTTNRQTLQQIVYAATTSAAALTPNVKPVNNLTNTYTCRIGADNGGGRQDMELMAVAIFRRALTAAEVATLTTEFQRRYA